jgi:hypothetical protein
MEPIHVYTLLSDLRADENSNSVKLLNGCAHMQSMQVLDNEWGCERKTAKSGEQTLLMLTQ